jgi:hypothetical protein
MQNLVENDRGCLLSTNAIGYTAVEIHYNAPWEYIEQNMLTEIL